MAFLLASGCQVNMAKTKIDNYYTSRTLITKIFGNRDIQGNDIKQIYEAIGVAPLPQLTKDGYRVIMLKIKDNDPLKFVFDLMAKLFVFFYSKNRRTQF